MSINNLGLARIKENQTENPEKVSFGFWIPLHELINNVFGRLDPQSLGLCAQVCKDWKNLINPNNASPIWKNAFHRRLIDNWRKCCGDEKMPNISCFTNPKFLEKTSRCNLEEKKLQLERLIFAEAQKSLEQRFKKTPDIQEQQVRSTSKHRNILAKRFSRVMPRRWFLKLLRIDRSLNSNQDSKSSVSEANLQQESLLSRAEKALLFFHAKFPFNSLDSYARSDNPYYNNLRTENELKYLMLLIDKYNLTEIIM